MNSNASSLLCPPPRVGTSPDPTRPTFGDEVARWQLALAREHLLPWQRYVADVAGELGPDGLRRYRTVVLKMPRQQGKSWLLDAHLMAAVHRPGRRTAVYVAQDGNMARRRVVDELGRAKLANVPVLVGQYRMLRGNNGGIIEFGDLSTIRALASNDKAGHGLTVDDVVIDEAFNFKTLEIINQLQPTTITRPDPQMWIVSTPGNGDDALMLHYEEVAATAVHDPDTTVAVFDWSATPDDDRTDPAVWRRVMPSLDITITEDRVTDLLRTTPPAEFDRAYLARRPTSATVAALDLAGWNECRNLAPAKIAPAGGVTIGLEVDVDRTRAVIAVACGIGPRVGVVVNCQPGTRWVRDAVRELVHRAGITVVDVWADRRSGLGGVIDELAHIGVTVHEVTVGDIASAAGTMYDLTAGTTAGIVHDQQPELDGAVIGSRRRALGDGGWTFSKLESEGDVAPLAAATLAVAAYRQHFTAAGALAGIS